MFKKDVNTLSKEENSFFQKYDQSEITASHRILCTPSAFAKDTLWYVQEVGTLKSLKPHTSQREELDSYLFMIVLSGKGIFTYNEETIYLKPNDIVFIDCKKKYSHRSSSTDPWELIWVHFNGPSIANYYKLFFGKMDSIVFNSHSSSDFENTLFQLIDLASSENATSELLSSNLLNTLITQALTLEKLDIKINRNINSEKINQIKQYIDKNFKKKLSLDNIAKKFYISKYYMSREFKKNYGITINNYVVNKRTTLAKELLRFTDKSIGEIGQLCGIIDNSYFNKVFQKNENMSPSEYRKKWNGMSLEENSSFVKINEIIP